MKEFIRPQFPPKIKSVSSRSALAEFARTHDHCQACGLEGPCTIHHVIGGRGGRSDEAANLLYLCWDPCHRLAEKEQIAKVFGGPSSCGSPARSAMILPIITLGIALSMKMRAGELTAKDLERLTELHGRRLPDFEAIPQWFDEQYWENVKRHGGAA